MITRIGIIAGEIWRILEEEEKISLSALVSKIGRDICETEKLVCMSIGWLAREGHIVLKKKNLGYIVYLRNSQVSHN